MGLLYQEKKNLTIDKVIEMTEQYVFSNIDQFQEHDLERVPYFKDILLLPSSKQKRIIDCTSKIDKTMVFRELKVSTVLALGNVMLLKQSNVNQLSNDQLIYLSCFLTEKPLETYQRTTTILGNRTVLDPLFQLTTNFFQQRSILKYIDDMSTLDVKNEKDSNHLEQFQNKVNNFLTTSTLEQVLEKTNYQQELADVQESLNQIL